MIATLIGIVVLSLVSIGAATTGASSRPVDFNSFMPAGEDIVREYDYTLDHSRPVTTGDRQGLFIVVDANSSER
jgi:hypothetical protein